MSCSRRLWNRLSRDLRSRGLDTRESGAFLLGYKRAGARVITDYILYDDVDPNCLKGYIDFDGSCIDQVWAECAKRGLEIVADVHTHPVGCQQSAIDQAHPMVPRKGHIALIVPDFAARVFTPSEIGIFELKARGEWLDHSPTGKDFFALRWL